MICLVRILPDCSVLLDHDSIEDKIPAHYEHAT